VGRQFVPAVRAGDAIDRHRLRARRHRFAGVARCMGWTGIFDLRGDADAEVWKAIAQAS
jgi:hypothetical protein